MEVHTQAAPTTLLAGAHLLGSRVRACAGLVRRLPSPRGRGPGFVLWISSRFCGPSCWGYPMGGSLSSVGWSIGHRRMVLDGAGLLPGKGGGVPGAESQKQRGGATCKCCWSCLQALFFHRQTHTPERTAHNNSYRHALARCCNILLGFSRLFYITKASTS